jgi:outer membrane protein OmpA-like peptidoglycan-associated protein
MKIIYFSLILLLSIVVSAQSQEVLSTKSKKAEKLYSEAMKSYNLRYFDTAAESLKAALIEDDKFIEAWLTLAEVYMDMKNDAAAIETYKKAIQISPDFFQGVYLNLAELEFLNGKYEDAKIQYNKYLTYNLLPEKKRRIALAGISNCDFSIWAVQHPVPFQPINMGSNINNQLDQYWPSISVDEHTFVFTLLLPKDPNNPTVFGNRQEDFYESNYGQDGWSPARNVGPPLNTFDNEGAQTLSADGKEMYFTACNRRDGQGLCDIYYTKFNGEVWTIPENIGRPVNTNYKETQPSLSPDGHTLYFASNRPGGKGGLDIWQSTLRNDGTWSEPINLGDSINTAGEEQSPFIHADNKSLYFSSTGWPGLGRFDLFLSRRKLDDTWSIPQNLGYPINTQYSEEGMIVNAKGNTAFYSSTRDGGFGGRDIYEFELYKEVRPQTVSYMKGTVYDAITKKPLKAKFELIDLQTAKTVMESYSLSSDGTFLISIPTDKDYALNANRQGYLFYSANFTLSHGDYKQPYLMDVPLNPIKPGEKSILRNIFFDTDRFTLKQESKAELERLVQLLRENPTVKLQLSGHTDNTGSSEHNKILSDKRANAVVQYLIDNGIPPARLSSKGYGETQPIASNDSDEGKAQNRRTEFMVTD